MPPDTPPPDDVRRSSSPSEGGNVVDPTVLAERRAQRAEQAEQSAARRAADAQVLAAQLARERARLEAERDAARAEASAAREGADAAIAEARHLQAERDELRTALEAARAERSEAGEPGTAAAEPAHAGGHVAAEPPPGARNGHAVVPAGWSERLRHELAVARTAAAVAPAGPRAASAPVAGLARERRLLARRAAAGPVATSAAPALPGRRGDRAAPITALALERERSSRLQAQLDSSLAVQRELRTHIAALQRAVHQRVEAERRIEAALRRVREELSAANALAAARRQPLGEAAGASALAQPAGAFAPAAPFEPAPAAEPAAAAPPLPLESGAPPDAPRAADSAAPSALDAPAMPEPSEEAPARVGLDPLRLTAARERLRTAPAYAPPLAPLPAAPPAPWLTAALQRLLAEEPQAAGQLAVGLLAAQAMAAERPLRCDLVLAGRGCYALDVVPGAPAAVTARPAPRPRGERDLRIAGDAAGIARLLHGRRALLRRPARVRGRRSALRVLRELARAPLGVRDLGAAGVPLEPALALRLIALAIEPGATRGERFAIAHAPLAGGPVDAWLRIADGAAPAVALHAPPEPTRLTLRCTRGALLALLAGVEPAPGESGALDGDERVLALVRGWIAATEHPDA